MGETPDALSETISELIATLTERGFETVHLGIFDLDGTFRERRFSIPQLQIFLQNGPTFVNVLHKWDVADTVTGSGPFVGEPIAMDPASTRAHPFEEHAAIAVADFTGTFGKLSPRNLLAEQERKAESLGYKIKTALEFEFIVLDETAVTLREKGFADLKLFAPDNRCWSGLSAAVHADLVSALDETLKMGDVSVFALGMELGPGCFEATLGAKSAMAAADDAAFFRLFTKAFFRQNDLTASFMSQLGAEFPGLSGHVHLSLQDEASGRNLFHDPDAENGMSDLFRHFTAGIAHLTGDMLAFSAHTVNAYRRLTPGNWAPRTASWALQNYAAAIRIVPGPETACRLEYRLPSADTNPHLTLAFMIAAGLWGIETKAELPPPMEGGGPDETPDGIPLPHDLWEAIDRLEGSSLAAELMGAEFVDYFVASRRHEEITLRKQVSAQERQRYLEIS